jgi:type IV secretory pathway TraG/TraD family ATPase VirD4
MKISRRKGEGGLPSRPWNMGKPLLRFSNHPADQWTTTDALEHALIVGGTGSGKTSGSATAIASVFLAEGWGGLVLCAKPDEASRWCKLCQKTGREKSLILMNAQGHYRINFIDYLMRLPREMGGGSATNVVEVLLHVIEASQTQSGAAPENDFWRKALRQLLTCAIITLYHAHGRVRLDELIQLVNSVPSSEEQARDPDYRSWSFCYSTLKKLFVDPAVPIDKREAGLITAYFARGLGRLDPKTRSNIIITLSAELDLFMRGPLHTLFCTNTNIIPEATHEGVVLVVDLPLKRYEHIGRVAQILVKYLWQKATERRTVYPHTRPVFLFADEAQLFISSYDMEFLSTARSARAATVYITQNLPSLYASIGGAHPQDRVDALVGNFQTKIFHANTCHRTNQWAADMIGKAVQRRYSNNWSASNSAQRQHGTTGSWGTQEGESGGRNRGSSAGFSYSDPGGPISVNYSANSGSQSGTSSSRSKGGGWSRGSSNSYSESDGGGWSEQVDYVVQPADFANRLRQGGPRNHFFVTGVVLQANRAFSRTGTCWTPVAFHQS